MRYALLCVAGLMAWPGFAGAKDHTVVAAFELGGRTLEVRVNDVEQTKAQFGETGAGLYVLFTDEFGTRLSEFTQAGLGQIMRFDICGDKMIEAVVQATISRRIAISVDGLGTAAWYEGYLNGKRRCND